MFVYHEWLKIRKIIYLLETIGLWVGFSYQYKSSFNNDWVNKNASNRDARYRMSSGNEYEQRKKKRALQS
jgi:hypothetical protein